jgi:hypothetical protein
VNLRGQKAVLGAAKLLASSTFDGTAVCTDGANMTRMTLAVAVWIILVSVAAASTSAVQKSSAPTNDILRPKAPRLWDHARNQATERAAKSEFIVTDQTEIFVNGKACKYVQVPSHARIVDMEVAADKKTVLRIHFRADK